jgi:hypothetical protein
MADSAPPRIRHIFRRGERINVAIDVKRFNIKGLDELACVADVLALSLYQGARTILIGEIPTEIEVLGTKRLVDVYGKGEEFEFYGEIERNRELLQGEIIGLRDALNKRNQPYRLVGFLVSFEQEYDRELLWQSSVKVYSFAEIPVYRIHIKRGLAWI